MAITPIFTPQIIARNAGALYGTILGSTAMKYCLTQAGTTHEQLNNFLNSVYTYSVAGVTNLDVAKQMIHNFGIPASSDPDSAYQIAYDYIVNKLDAAPYATRGEVVSNITFLFSNLTDNAKFGDYAKAYNTAVESALTYAESNSSNAPFDPANPEGQTFILTTGIDIATADLFDGSFNANGFQTLNSGDQLTGQGITGNVLDAQIYSSVTPANLTNIQTVEVTASFSLNNVVGDVISGVEEFFGGDYNFPSATVDLINATGTTTLVNDGSARDIAFTNVAASANNVTVQNTSNDTEVDYTSTTGDQTVNLTVSNVGASAQSAIIINGVETMNIVSSGAANDVLLDGDAIETINVSGAQDLALDIRGLTENVSNVNASALTGDLYLDMQAQTGVLDSTVITVTSGQGDDNINLTNVTQLLNVTLGDGDDELEDNLFTVNDSVDGGLGYDALETTYLTAVDLSAETNNVNGIEELELSDSLAGNLDLTKIDSTITELELSGDSGNYIVRNDINGSLISADSNVTGAAGTLTVELGEEYYKGSSVVMQANLTVTDTGTAITDAVVFNNFVTDGFGTNEDVFNGFDITSTGYENVTINTGAASYAYCGQNIGDLTITADAASSPVSLVATGNSSLDIDCLHTNSTGLTTVDASGLNVLATQDGLYLAGTTLGALGTQNILGTAGMDTVLVGNFASTIDGGAGNDQLVGGTLADVIDGGTGNDTIASGGGNDVIRGGNGNDLIATVSVNLVPAAGNVSIDGGAGDDIVALFNTLTASDSVDGGAGVNTLYLETGATGQTGVGIKNFQVLATSVSQTMTNFTNNTGWTSVGLNAAGITINNASAILNTVSFNDNAQGGTVEFNRLVDTGTDSLTVATDGTSDFFGNLSPVFDGTITTLRVNDEESLTINVSNGASSVSGALTIDTLAAADLTSLILTGDHDVSINAITGNTTLATINATGITAGSVLVNAGSSTVAVTATGSATVANTLTTGSLADTITTGSGNDNITGSTGADLINVGSGTDTITYLTMGDTLTSTTVFTSGLIVTAADIVTGMGNGDFINLVALDNGAASVGTSFAANLSADALNLVQGSYNGTSFTAGSASTDNDYFLQIVESDPTAANSGVVLVDIVGTVTATVGSGSETIFLSVV